MTNRQWTSWTPAERSRLYELFTAGMPITEIAKLLGRTAKAVHTQYYYILRKSKTDNFNRKILERMRESREMPEKTWIYFDPADQATAAMLDFILLSCREIRHMAENYKDPIAQDIVADFLDKQPAAQVVPRYTLKEAIFAAKYPDSFKLPPREGWMENISLKKAKSIGISWEEYNTIKKSARKDARKVDALAAYDDFLLEKKLVFKWGTLIMHSGYIAKLGQQAGEYSGSLLGHIQWMEVRVVKNRNGRKQWKMHFHLSGTT